MESRRVYRDNTIVYKDLYYIWTYMPQEVYKSFYKHTQRHMYKKHICGVGFYSRLHARHVVANKINSKALLYIHIVKGSTLIKQGITTLPKRYNNRIFVNDPHTPNGSRKITRWVYPSEFMYDKHRRRHFILYMVSAAEDRGVKAFNNKYKKYFNGYRESLSVRNYLRRKRSIYLRILREYRIARRLPEDGITYDRGMLKLYNIREKKKQSLSKS